MTAIPQGFTPYEGQALPADTKVYHRWHGHGLTKTAFNPETDEKLLCRFLITQKEFEALVPTNLILGVMETVDV